MLRSTHLRATIIAASLLVLCILPANARAGVLLTVDIRGTIYRDDMPPVRISCRGSDGNRVDFVNGDVDTGTLPAFEFANTCGLHSSQGLFTSGEAWNNEAIDEEATQTIVTRAIGGPEASQHTLTTEKMNTGMYEMKMILEYSARFPIDDGGSLVPPITSARGSMILVNDTADQVFVGTFRTGRPYVP